MRDPNFNDALVFTGGGTGGHYFPAVALAEEAHARWLERPIAFVGALRGIEARKLPESGWPYLLLDVEGFLGRSPLSIARSAWKLWRAVAVLKRLWKRQRPAAVVGTGGYGAAPALLAARSLGIPYFLHESNAEPGAVVKLVSRGARRVWCGLDAALERLPNAPCRAVGTPVRQAFRRDFAPLEALKPPFRLLVLGGSGGARILNETLLETAGPLLERFPDWEILHQAGAQEFERLRERQRHPRHALVPFIEAVDEALESASLVLSRSGASTCAELKACGRPALLVPLPTSAGDHQRRNALALAAEGRAQVVEQAGPFRETLVTHLAALMANPGARAALARPESNRALEACLEDLASILG